MNRKLLDHLLKNNVCTSSALQRALSAQRTRGGDVMDLLIEQGGVDEDALARALGSFYNWKVVDLSRVEPRRDALDRANGEFCRRHLVLPFTVDRTSGDLLVAVVDPARAHRALRAFQTQTGQRIRPYVAARQLLLDAVERHYGTGAAELAGGGVRAEISSIGMVPGIDSHPGRGLGSAPSGRVESFSSIDQFFEDGSGGSEGSPFGFGGTSQAFGESSLFGPSYNSTINYNERSRGPGGTSGELPAFPRAVAPPAAAVSAELIERLRSENEALRHQLYRVETSLQLEINLLRELVDLLLEAGVIDRRAYLERMGKLR